MIYKLKNLFALALFALMATVTINAQSRAYTASDSQVQYLLNRIETRTDTYKRNVSDALDRSSLNNTETEDLVSNYISEFENSTDALKQKFEARESVDADVQDVLSRSANINQFMKNNRLTTLAQNDWTAIRTDLTTLARYYSVSWNWNNTSVDNNQNNATRPYRVSDSTVQTLLNRIESSTDIYRRSVTNALNRNTNEQNNVIQFVNDFENETDKLKQKFDSRSSVSKDVSELLNRASYIETFMRNNQLNAASQRNWRTLRTDLNTLANYYNVSWNWNNIPQQNSRTDVNGTYRLNVNQNENVSTIVGNAVNKYYSGNQRDRVRNGQTYKFAGLVDQVKLANGKEISVNNEGSVQDGSQTKKTVTRGAIGAGIGAIIGAIAGGGKGAAIGAVVGGGAGAGSVLIQGKDDVELENGTEFMLTATAPANLGYTR